MEQETFPSIMKDIFIPYAEKMRGLISESNKQAALIVDEHKSRYFFFLSSLELLRGCNIALVILPSNISRVTQPLDLGLNRLIKLYFREEYVKLVL